MSTYKSEITRRKFFSAASAISAFSIVPLHVLGRASTKPPSDKLNITGISAGGRGYFVLKNARVENIVALCDVNTKRAGKTFRRFPTTGKFSDYRTMLERKEKTIDAVIIAAPDHHHIPASIMAMKMDKHVYCEKLTWDTKNMKVTNCPGANRFTHRESYRKGWEI